jgi:hypothetical protein
MLGAAVAALVLAASLTACSSTTGAEPTTTSTASEAASAAVAAEAPASEPSAGPAAFTPLVGSALFPPVPAPMTDGRTHLAYELQLTNALSQPATIDAVQVQAGSSTLLTLDTAALAKWIRPLGGELGNRVLQAGQSAIVWLDVTLGPGASVPSALKHTVTVSYARPIVPIVAKRTVEVIAPVTVSSAKPVQIASPLRGSGWIDANSCCAVTPHRAAVNPIGGALYVPERFAVDWVQLNSAGQLISGAPTAMSSYAYFGAPIHAVADGPIVSMTTNLPEQPPGANPDPSTLTLAEYGGNSIVQKIGDHEYAFYAHLQPGNPLHLKMGQQLKSGDVIAKLGNTGNTSAPHLHFHIMDRPDPLAANGLPFVIRSFEYQGSISEASLDAIQTKSIVADIDRAGTGGRVDQTPLYLSVMSY